MLDAVVYEILSNYCMPKCMKYCQILQLDEMPAG
jgi:hypothetical protein